MEELAFKFNESEAPKKHRKSNDWKKPKRNA